MSDASTQKTAREDLTRSKNVSGKENKSSGLNMAAGKVRPLKFKDEKVPVVRRIAGARSSQVSNQGSLLNLKKAAKPTKI